MFTLTLFRWRNYTELLWQDQYNHREARLQEEKAMGRWQQRQVL